MKLSHISLAAHPAFSILRRALHALGFGFVAAILLQLFIDLRSTPGFIFAAAAFAFGAAWTRYACEAVYGLFNARRKTSSHLDSTNLRTIRWQPGPANEGGGSDASVSGVARWKDGEELVVVADTETSRTVYSATIWPEGADQILRSTVTGEVRDVRPDEISWWAPLDAGFLPHKLANIANAPVG